MDTIIAKFEQNADDYLNGKASYQETIAHHRDARILMLTAGTKDGEQVYRQRCHAADNAMLKISHHAKGTGNVTLPEFWMICQGHDWYYAYSDDHRVYQAGYSAEQWINAIADANGRDYLTLLTEWRNHKSYPADYAMPAIPQPIEYRYRLTATGASSDKYGPCEVCKKPATAVFHLVEERSFADGWTYDGCRNLFGHENCLEA